MSNTNFAPYVPPFNPENYPYSPYIVSPTPVVARSCPKYFDDQCHYSDHHSGHHSNHHKSHHGHHRNCCDCNIL